MSPDLYPGPSYLKDMLSLVVKVPQGEGVLFKRIRIA